MSKGLSLSGRWRRFAGWWREHWDWDYALAGAIITVVLLGLLTMFAVMGMDVAPKCSKDCDSRPVYIWYIPIYWWHYPAGEYPNYDGPPTGTYKYYYQEHGTTEPGVRPRPGEEPQSPHGAPPEEHPVVPEPHISEP